MTPSKTQRRPAPKPRRSGPASGGTKKATPGQRQPKPVRSQRPTGKKTSFRKKITRRPDANKLRIAVIGGAEEVGRNCTMLEYGNDIIFIDMGLQFPEEDMPGIDYIIPNMEYVKDKKKNVKGIIVTHAHMDHIGGIPHIAQQIGNPPIYAMPFTEALIKRRQEDFHSGQLNLKRIKDTDTLQLGQFKVTFFRVNHSIPDAVGVVIDTPAGRIVHTGDWKFDWRPVGTEPIDLRQIAEIGRGNVLALMSDSTSALKPGHQISEHEIGINLHNMLVNIKGRTIIGTFASQLSRVKQILELSEKLGKKVVIDGYSMKTNVEIGKALGFINAKQSTFIDVKQIANYPKDKVVIVCTGAQGERNAVLMRIANNEHKYIKIIPDDTIVFSSSVIPGNERTVQRLKDTLYRKNANVIHTDIVDLHAGGHAKAEDVKLMLMLLRPKYFIPIEGNHFLLKENAVVAKSVGWRDENIFIPDNGQVMEFAKNHGRLTTEHLPADYIFVDGLGVGDVSQVVLRDRQVLSGDGMIVIITTVSRKTGQLMSSPDIISRGFVYMKENKKLIEDTRRKVKQIVVDRDPKSSLDTDYVKNKIRNEIGKFIYKKTERRPMILPVIIEV